MGTIVLVGPERLLLTLSYADERGSRHARQGLLNRFLVGSAAGNPRQAVDR
jgi:hypothetical protein